MSSYALLCFKRTENLTSQRYKQKHRLAKLQQGLALGISTLQLASNNYGGVEGRMQPQECSTNLIHTQILKNKMAIQHEGTSAKQ